MAAGLPKMKKYIIAVVVFLFVAQVCALACKPRFAVESGSAVAEVVEAQCAVVSNIIEEDAVQKTVWDVGYLELIGTAMGNPKDPVAFIKDARTGKQGIYKRNQNIDGGSIISISKGSVELEKEGSRAVLYMKRSFDKVAGDTGRTAPISFDGNECVMNRAALLQETAQVLNSIRLMKVQPYMQQNMVIGMQVNGVKDGTLIAQAGIQDRDVVTMVNNQKIDSYQKALQVSNKVKNQERINVCVLRGGKQQQLSYRFAN
jgi:type II secretion system protein C